MLAAFLLNFFVLTGYFSIRPVRETIGTILGADHVANLFVMTWIASIALVPAYGAVSARFPRRVFLPWTYGVIAASFFVCGAVFLGGERRSFFSSFFYVWVSVLALFVTSIFWSFMLEMFDPKQAKRLFGMIAAGGTAGAVAGPLVTGVLAERVGDGGILLFGGGMFVLAIVSQRMLITLWAGQSWSSVRNLDRPLGGNPFAGFPLVLKSPYLLGIALYVVLLAAVNTFLYFEQMRLVTSTFHDTAMRTKVFSQLDVVVQVLTLFIQFFLTGRLATRLGLGFLLVAVPLLMVGGMIALGMFHTFTVLALVFVARRVGEYSLVRPGREMLFSPLDKETKYKAKNLIDVPVYRGGDAIVAKFSALVTTAGWSATWIAAGCALFWSVTGLWLARRDELLERRSA